MMRDPQTKHRIVETLRLDLWKITMALWFVHDRIGSTAASRTEAMSAATSFHVDGDLLTAHFIIRSTGRVRISDKALCLQVYRLHVNGHQGLLYRTSASVLWPW